MLAKRVSRVCRVGYIWRVGNLFGFRVITWYIHFDSICVGLKAGRVYFSRVARPVCFLHQDCLLALASGTVLMREILLTQYVLACQMVC